MFIDMATAFRRLDDERVESLRGLCAVHAYNNHDGLHVISAGETYENSFGVSLEALEPEE